MSTADLRFGSLSLSDSDSDDGIELPRLKGREDYLSWSYRMQVILESRQVFTYVTGETPKPPVGANPSDIREWERADMYAGMILCDACTDTVALHVRFAKTSKQAWDRLATLYKPNEILETIRAAGELANAKWDETQEIEEHFQNMRLLRMKLDIGNDPKAKAMTWLAAVVNCLPPSAKTIVTMSRPGSLSGAPPEKIVEFTENLINRLIEWDYTRKDNLSHDVGPSIQNRYSEDKRNMKCHYCNKKGHFARECRKREVDRNGGHNR